MDERLVPRTTEFWELLRGQPWCRWVGQEEVGWPREPQPATSHGPAPHANLTALSDTAWALALASAKAVVDDCCSGNPLSAFVGPPYHHGATGHTGCTIACRGAAETQGWEVKTISCHLLSLCLQKASRDLLRGKDQTRIFKTTFPHCGQQLRWW